MSKQHELSVRLHGVPLGTLRLNSGSLQFTYEQTAARPLSLSMPITTNTYKNKVCEAFFGGLLPEDPDKKKLIARLFGINSNSNFSLLESIGSDCAGAVSLHKTDEPVIDDQFQPITGSALTERELHRLLSELPSKPLLAGVDGIRISLAGAQEKAALCLIDDVLNVPGQNVPSTHILKPRIAGLGHSVANEYFCMTLAHRVGLNCASVEFRYARDIEYLLVQRYDRSFTAEGHIRRVHQEDFCQALGIVSTKKYEADGGPSLKDCFALTEKFSFPAIDKIELLNRVLFNFVIGNADCHGKNYSLLHYENGQLKLAPAYDILCTAIYSKLNTNMAMSIGGQSDLDGVREQHWQKFCKTTNVLPAALKRAARNLSKRIQTEAHQLRADIANSDFPLDTIDKIVELIDHRVWLLDTTMKGVA